MERILKRTTPVLDELDRWIAGEEPGYFAAQEPFPHAVIDDTFDRGVLRAVLGELPADEEDVWDRAEDHGIQVKLRSNWQSDVDIEPLIRELVHFLNSNRSSGGSHGSPASSV